MASKPVYLSSIGPHGTPQAMAGHAPGSITVACQVSAVLSVEPPQKVGTEKEDNEVIPQGRASISMPSPQTGRQRPLRSVLPCH